MTSVAIFLTGNLSAVADVPAKPLKAVGIFGKVAKKVNPSSCFGIFAGKFHTGNYVYSCSLSEHFGSHGPCKGVVVCNCNGFKSCTFRKCNQFFKTH